MFSQLLHTGVPWKRMNEIHVLTCLAPDVRFLVDLSFAMVKCRRSLLAFDFECRSQRGNLPDSFWSVPEA